MINLRPLRTQWKKLRIKINLALPDAHVPEAERNIRTVKNRIRVAYNRQVNKAIPHAITIGLVKSVVRSINMFPADNGISKIFSPFEIVKNQGVDYKKISAAEFGQYVQAYNDPVTTRTNEPRTIAGIFIGPLDNIQGGYEIYDLQTRRVKPRNKITVLPMALRFISLIRHAIRIDVPSS